MDHALCSMALPPLLVISVTIFVQVPTSYAPDVTWMGALCGNRAIGAKCAIEAGKLIGKDGELWALLHLAFS
ncbi:hypothetical protein RSOLAG22IIIB_11298 [Rhizoctonia solani]|uniref:Uncharacterized protein n=1 Tax=Rhizoctonia solani TaxID=456999 RepID=A0A0K6G895_9AGAM|nr:hypothetical protein RSOLAG22IIIB_11298 [Rhizoctonia solani]